MRLHAEYIQRHRLKVPLVQYDRRSVVFLCSKGTPITWRIASFVWRHIENHPGFFEHVCLTPIHNGVNGRELFSSSRISTVYWDQYEQMVLDMMSGLRRDFIAVSQNDLMLAAWKIFLFVCDSFLACRMESDFFLLVGNSMSSSLGLLDRLQHQAIAAAMIQKQQPDLYNVWRSQIVPLVGQHSVWLEELVNG